MLSRHALTVAGANEVVLHPYPLCSRVELGNLNWAIVRSVCIGATSSRTIRILISWLLKPSAKTSEQTFFYLGQWRAQSQRRCGCNVRKGIRLVSRQRSASPVFKADAYEAFGRLAPASKDPQSWTTVLFVEAARGLSGTVRVA